MMMVAHVTENPRYAFNKSCEHCGIVFTVYIDPNDFSDWLSGSGFIQDLMPYLCDGERELLLSGTCGSCFDEIMENA
jgi:hypothetical protein